MISKGIFAILVWVLLLSPAPAQSPTVLEARDPAAIAAALHGFGYRAELTTDDEGDPKLRSAASGFTFSILFYGCKGGANCTSIQFLIGFDGEDSVSVDLMNAWNQDRRFGAASVDADGDPSLTMDVMMGLAASRWPPSAIMWSGGRG